MKQTHRVLCELLLPCPIAALFFSLPFPDSIFGSTWSTSFPAFPFIVLIGYTVGFIPSVVYTLGMEIWFESGKHRKLGLKYTALFSAGMGAVANLLFDSFALLAIGAAIGLLVGTSIGALHPVVQPAWPNEPSPPSPSP